MTETGITVTLRTTPDRLRAAKRELETAWAGGDDQEGLVVAFFNDLDHAIVTTTCRLRHTAGSYCEGCGREF